VAGRRGPAGNAPYQGSAAVKENSDRVKREAGLSERGEEQGLSTFGGWVEEIRGDCCPSW
jgi:hypothetical protein